MTKQLMAVLVCLTHEQCLTEQWHISNTSDGSLLSGVGSQHGLEVGSTYTAAPQGPQPAGPPNPVAPPPQGNSAHKSL